VVNPVKVTSPAAISVGVTARLIPPGLSAIVVTFSPAAQFNVTVVAVSLPAAIS
jgi:hypothetical protein